MKNRKINLFEFPSNLGLKKKDSDPEPGVKLLPGWMRKMGFHDLVDPDCCYTLEPPPYSMIIDPESGVRNADGIIQYAKSQARLLSDKWDKKSFTIFLGGDCSVLIGISMALKTKGNYGLFFLDGHTDYVSPKTSISKAAAAMELAIITGYGHEKLTNISGLVPYFDPKNIWCVGNREYDPEVVNEIEGSDIHYYDLKKLREVGLKNCASDFLKMVEENQLNGFLIHLDVDVLDYDIMPAVDSQQEGGLNYKELNILLGGLLRSKKALGLEVTILDPNLDEDGVYTKELISNLTGPIKDGQLVWTNERIR